jgi:hypothetical protein
MRFPFFEQIIYLCFHIAQCANIAEFADIAELFWQKTFSDIWVPL